MGKSDNIDILVNIRNKAEDAYEARLIIDMPPGIQYNGIRNQFVSILSLYQLFPCSPKGEGGILFYLCPSVRPRYFSSHFSQ
jgi:hypothetical protein